MCEQSSVNAEVRADSRSGMVMTERVVARMIAMDGTNEESKTRKQKPQLCVSE